MIHTMTELMGMSDELLRVEVATIKGNIPFAKDHCPVCGSLYNKDGGYFGCEPGNCSLRPKPKIRADEKYPEYSTDIRAAYELEESVPEELREKYSKNLEYIVAQSEDTRFCRTGKIANWYLIHAPARIRCIAYILTVQKDSN